MKNNWFKDWFNTKHYHILYKNRDDNEAQKFIKSIRDYLQIPITSKVLDLACGKGRHAVYLNSLGFDTTGVDLSEESIIAAKKYESSSLFFDVHDMRKVYKENEYDYEFNLFTSFGYFDNEVENQQSINAMNKNLNLGGKLVLDFMNAKKVISNLVSNEVKTIDNIDFKISRVVEDGFIKKRINFSDEGKEFSFEERVKAIYLNDFRDYFEKAGFKIKDIFGDYSLSPFDENISDRLIFVCVK